DIMTRRREFLAGLAATAALVGFPRRARAIGTGSQLRIGELTFAGLPEPGTPRAAALARLGFEIETRTSVEVSRLGNPTQVVLPSPKLYDTPLLYLAGDRRFTMPAVRDMEALRRFLTFGGFLFIDSAEGRAGGDFDASVRQLCADLYPPPA